MAIVPINGICIKQRTARTSPKSARVALTRKLFNVNMRPDKNATILPMMVNASGPTTNIISIYIAEIGRMAGFFEKFCIKSLNKEKDFTPNPLNLDYIFSL